MKKIRAIALLLVSSSLLFGGGNQRTRARRRERLARELKARSVISPQAASEQQLPTPIDEYPLHDAIAHDDAKKLMVLLSTGSYDINGIDKTMRSPLHTAVEYQSTACIALLITHGASLTTRIVMGFTPLHCAAMCNNAEIAQMLLTREPRLINEQDMLGCTAMHIAASSCTLDFVELLITHNANLNNGDSSGNTALHCAITRSNEVHKDKIIKIIATTCPELITYHNGQKQTPLHIFLYLLLKKVKKGSSVDTNHSQRMINLLYNRTIANSPDNTGITCQELLDKINRYLPYSSKLYFIL